MHRTQRPGPLRDLPLEPFVHPPGPDSMASAKQTRSNKRQLSPGQPSLFSPTKRRILFEEGIHLPEKTVKMPLPSSGRGNPTSFVRFAHDPKDHSSPARVLNFGLPKNLQGDPQKRSSSAVAGETNQQSTSSSSSSTRIAPSIELKTKVSSRTHARHSQVVQSDDSSNLHDTLVPSSSANQGLPSFVPRELPPQTDPRSVHFPGFFVHQDTHVAVYPTAEVDANEGYQQTNEECQQTLGVDDDEDREKENLPPRRRTKKLPAPSSIADLKANHDPHNRSWLPSGVSKSTNATPKKTSIRTECFSTTTNSTLRARPAFSSPAEEKKALRQTLKDEMDMDEDQDDDA